MRPPTNCRCLWSRRPPKPGPHPTTTWVRVGHQVGCPVHGADNQPPEDQATTSSAQLVFNAPHRSGMTVQDIYDIAVACIEAGADPAWRLKVRIGWRNNLVQVHVGPEV